MAILVTVRNLQAIVIVSLFLLALNVKCTSDAELEMRWGYDVSIREQS